MAPLKDVKGQLYLGDESFFNKIKGFIRGKETLKEIPRMQRYITKPSLDEIFKHGVKKLKDKAVHEAHIRYGYTLKEIAEHIGVHYTTVSRAVNRIEGKQKVILQDLTPRNDEMTPEKKLFNQALADYMIFYNTKRIHKSLNKKTPIQFIIDKGELSHMSLSYTPYYIKQSYSALGIDGGINFSAEIIEQLPIPKIPESAQQPFVTLVDQILSAKQKDPSADTSVLERQIDKILYELYGLTPRRLRLWREKDKVYNIYITKMKGGLT